MPDGLRAEPDTPVAAVHAGLVPYGVAWDWQCELARRRADGELGDVLLTLEHPRVYTLGKRADDGHLLWSEAERAARGIETHRVDRGGDVTYHGPGQLVAYPILALTALRGVVEYVRVLEQVCIDVAASFGVTAHRVADYTGVWVGDEKLVAIGVRVGRRGVTTHGLAYNVTTDLGDFDGIVPCGIADGGVCSLSSLGVETTVAEVLRRLQRSFAARTGASLVERAVADLGLPAAPATVGDAG